MFSKAFSMLGPLLGIVDALKTQEQDPAMRELSFLEQLGLLVDQQWIWRENQALTRRLHAAKLKGAAVGRYRLPHFTRLDKDVIRAMAQKSASVEQYENISSRARWPRRLAAMDILHCICGLRRCSAIWPSHEPMAACAVYWRGFAAWMCW